MSAATLDPNAMANFLSFLSPGPNAPASSMAPTIAGPPAGTAAPPADGLKGIDWNTLAPIFMQLIQQGAGKGYAPPAKDYSPTGKDFWDVFNNVAPVVLQTIQTLTKGVQSVPQQSTKAYNKDFLSDLGSVLPVIVQTVQALTKSGVLPQTQPPPDSKDFWNTFTNVVQTVGHVVQTVGQVAIPIITAVA